MPNLYTLRALTRTYGTRTVLDVEELSLEAGRIYTLTGANGAGKSTLLQVLAFLLPPTSGEIFFHGEPVAWSRGGLRRLRKEVTLLHQSPYLFSSSVFSNIAFGLRARGIDGGALRRRVSKALDTVGLAGFETRKARELSGGETQRVAMARALALEPAVLLLDEPLANIDRESAAILDRLIPSLPERGTTVILTTHDPLHADRIGSQTIHLEAGRLAGKTASVSHCQNDKRLDLCQVLQKPEKSFSAASLPSA
jgi:tungstate transport system ATP-binding protein